MSSLTFPSHLQLELVLLSSSSTGLTRKMETFGWCRCTRQFLKVSVSPQTVSLYKCTLGCYLKASRWPAANNNNNKWSSATSVKQYTYSICFQSHSCTSLLIQGCRDSLFRLGKLRPESYLRPRSLKHVSAEMAVEPAPWWFQSEEMIQLEP